MSLTTSTTSTTAASPTGTGSASPLDPKTDWVGVAREVGATLTGSAPEHDRAGEISRTAFAALRDAGLTAALVPAQFGGGNATHLELCEVLRALGRCDPAVAVTLSMHTHLVAAQVWRHNHGMDASGVLTKVATERVVLVSTGASDWVASNGAARRVEGGYRVDARKAPASGCEVGDVLATSIHWADAPDGAQVLHCSVPMRAEGVSIERTWDTLGLRATGSDTVVLHDVFVPDAAVSLIRPADAWHPIWNVVLGAALPLIMAAYLGVADAAVDLACSATSNRAGDHTFQLLGEMFNAHTSAGDAISAMVNDAANLTFANTDEHASRALARKTVATDALLATVRLAMEACGGVGYTRSFGLERLYRDVHGCLFHPLPRAKQTRFTGRVALGLSPVG